ncbi:unnamed protein product [Rotaria socialis]
MLAILLPTTAPAAAPITFIWCIFIHEVLTVDQLSDDTDNNDLGDRSFDDNDDDTGSFTTRRSRPSRPSYTRRPGSSRHTHRPRNSTNSMKVRSLIPSNICASGTCRNGAICSSQGLSSFICKCVGPWRGSDCSIPDACYSLPCKNSGNCTNAYDDYVCQCSSAYYGKNCDIKFTDNRPATNYCRLNPCIYGTCYSLSTTYYCSCPNRRYGSRCESVLTSRSAYQRAFNELFDGMKRAMTHETGSDGNNDNGENGDYHDNDNDNDNNDEN